MVVILTWRGERKIYDAGLITGADGEALSFATIALADEWCTENDNKLWTYSRLVDLNA